MEEYIHVLYFVEHKIAAPGCAWQETIRESCLHMFEDPGTIDGIIDNIREDIAEAYDATYRPALDVFYWASDQIETKLLGWHTITPAIYELLKEQGIGDYR